jgi:hypothetical protein
MAEEFDTGPSLVKSIMKSNSVIDIITHIRYINGVTAKAAGIRRLVER